MVQITPATAKFWLAHSIGNRNIRRAEVVKMKHDIESGNFHYNGNSIVFSDTHKLMDGHHRLTAISEAGKTIAWDVYVGLSETMMNYIDTGMSSRSFGDTLKINKVPNYNCIAGAVKVYMMLKKSRVTIKTGDGYVHSNGDDVLSNSEYWKVYLSDKAIFDNAASTLTSIKKLNNGLIPPATAAGYIVFLTTVKHHPIERPVDFFQKFYTNDVSSNPVDAIRRKLMQNKLSQVNKMTGLEITNSINKAWNLYIKGSSVHTIRTPKDGSYIELI